MRSLQQTPAGWARVAAVPRLTTNSCRRLCAHTRLPHYTMLCCCFVLHFKYAANKYGLVWKHFNSSGNCRSCSYFRFNCWLFRRSHVNIDSQAANKSTRGFFVLFFFLLLQQIMLFTLSFPLASCSQQQQQQYNSSTFHLHIAIREVITIISFKVDFPKWRYLRGG